jgi:1-aminocyclopropane-1-carboxylate deaminase/D-cysteine desulfhydrase-like pyridoxal-dependent ACC family enzyme
MHFSAVTATLRSARERLEAMPSIRLGYLPTPIDDADRLRDAIGMGARLLVKRDDALPFGFGGNKVRKLMLVAADAVATGATALITCGGIQSNHCRATASAAARLGIACHVVANGARPEHPTGNALLLQHLGAQITYVASRDERNPMMQVLAERVRASGGVPYVIPLGASNPLGALGFARGIGEIVRQATVPDVIVHASSSGGTQAGLIAGCALYDVRARVIGISADDSVAAIRQEVLGICAGIEQSLDLTPGALGAPERFEADASFVGEAYGVPTEASREAQRLAARHEALFVDHWYTAKALAGLVSYARRGEFRDGQTVMFWHTGGQIGLFA